MSTKDELDEIRDRLDALEAKADESAAPPSGGLFIFTRPSSSAPLVGLGSRMDAPDVFEAVKRACSGVNYQGTKVISGAQEDEVWAEIDRLKVGEAALVDKYRGLDPALAGFALLTHLIDVSRWDALGFGTNTLKRDALAGKTIASFLEDQFQIGHGGPGIGGE